MSWSTLITILFAAFRLGWSCLPDFGSWQITIRVVHETDTGVGQAPAKQQKSSDGYEVAPAHPQRLQQYTGLPRIARTV